MFSTIRNQMILFGVAATALIALLAGIALFAVNRLQSSLEDSVRSALAMRNHLQGDMMHDAIRADVLGAQLAAKNGDAKAIAEAASDLDEHFKEFLLNVDANLAVRLSPELDQRLRAVSVEIRKYGADAKAIVALIGTDAVAAERQVPDFLKQFTELEHSLADARDRIEALVRATDEDSRAASLQALLLVAGASVLTLVVVLASTMRLFRRIAVPLQTLRSVAERVNGGDLQARAQLGRGDELGAFADAFDQLLDERVASLNKLAQENERLNQSVIAVLRAVSQLSERDLTVKAPVTEDVIGTVSDSINSLTDATSRVLIEVNRIAAQVASVSDRVRSQGSLVSSSAQDERQDVEEMVSSLSGATQTMKQVASLAEQSNRAAERATEVTDRALDTVTGAVQGMHSIREIIAETEKRIKRLGERSLEISGIVNMINTISERTHVLALNASMQAAVAGEAGRGFAVVAEEVQRLAESSRTATQQIATVVHNIQLETNETIATMNKTIDQVVHGSEQAQRAGEQMRLTQEITGELVAQVRLIAQASDQQKTMSEQLLQAAQRIGSSNQRTSEQIEAQNKETQTLTESAARLLASVSVFRLPQAA